MFATYEPFKFQIQFQHDVTIWRCVEVMLNTPWLLANLEDAEGVRRTFLLKSPDDLLRMLRDSSLGKLTGLRLVLPPSVAPDGDWAFVYVCRVEHEVRSIEGAAPSAVLVSRDGQRYGGFPIERTTRDQADLVPLVELP